MGIFSSIKNQIGRDIGKSISNVVLKDAHATPIRHTKSKTKITAPIAKYESKLKLIDLSQTPKTIIRKLGVVLVEFESDINSYLSDGKIDLGEEIEIATRFYKIISVFSKIEKQFLINEESTDRLLEIYHNYFQKSILTCITQLKNQESDPLLASKYDNLYNEINATYK